MPGALAQGHRVTQRRETLWAYDWRWLIPVMIRCFTWRVRASSLQGVTYGTVLRNIGHQTRPQNAQGKPSRHASSIIIIPQRTYDVQKNKEGYALS
ncbi:hypothetical protein SDC9_06665 [bioreactor metagenome]|uniref:Uncharacterized protein n=1 Tax=bioreactor metagenome TaxID=1076179 RepID=A0A644T2H0_9ZZZZ